MNINPYQHHAKYYETDQMGIIHHSNYIRWFEEARIDFMNQIGLTYKTMEKEQSSSKYLHILVFVLLLNTKFIIKINNSVQLAALVIVL